MTQDPFALVDSNFSISGPNSAASAVPSVSGTLATPASAVMTGEIAFRTNASAGFGVEFLRSRGDPASMDGLS